MFLWVTTMALVGDGELFGSRQLDMGNSGGHLERGLLRPESELAAG